MRVGFRSNKIVECDYILRPAKNLKFNNKNEWAIGNMGQKPMSRYKIVNH